MIAPREEVASMARSSRRSEDQIRDYLADHLELIEPGLTLLSKERYLRNPIGATGFIDIFARSQAGQMVVIEIKRSDAAARQAVHELAKYIALLRTEFLIKNAEIRLMVLSTTWHELALPFAEFVNECRYDCEGREILLGPDGWPTATQAAHLPPIPKPRKFCRRHYIWEFVSETDTREAIPVLAEHMLKCGISDFVLLLLNLRHLPDGVSHMIYFAQQEASLEHYFKMIRSRVSDDSWEEFQLQLEDIPEEADQLEEAAEEVWHTGYPPNRLKYAATQISHPERARILLSPEQSEQIEVYRYGRFCDQDISDHKIIQELQGYGGGSWLYADMSAQLDSKPQVDDFLSAVNHTFFHNPDWGSAITILCKYAQARNATSIQLSAFNNDDILLSIAGIASGSNALTPEFKVNIYYAEAESDQFFGVLEWDGRQTELDNLVDTFLGGRLDTYLFHKHFGSVREINSDLMKELGLSYTVWHVTADRAYRARIRGSVVSEVRGTSYKSVAEFVESNREMAFTIKDFIVGHDQSVSKVLRDDEEARLRVAERSLLSLEDDRTCRREALWIGDVESCDVCGRSLNNATVMADVSIGGGGWGCVCALCFIKLDARLGSGWGQLYRQTDRGWLLVAGSASQDVGTDE